MVEVKLAGMNVDVDQLEKIYNLIGINNEEAKKSVKSLTPESIPAAYARISRDPAAIKELREKSAEKVAEARKSLDIITHTMGHKSIAEHAIFNMDISGLSRRAVEAVQEKRLMGFTEKSQRYITLDGDFVIPEEIKGTPLEKHFVNLVEKKQNLFYDNNLDKIQEWHFNKNIELLENAGKNIKKVKQTLKGYGKEDARYALSMATEAQMGMTSSGRNIESLITKLNSSNIKELQELGNKIFQEINGLAPSLVKYTNATDYFEKTRDELKEYVEELKNEYHFYNGATNQKSVILHSGLTRDDAIIAGLIFSSSNLDYQNCLELTTCLSNTEKVELLDVGDKYQNHHDPKLREYELGERVSEWILSSSAFAQMKRHRMQTTISQLYDPALGMIIPESIKGAGLEKELQEVGRESVKVYDLLIKNGVPIEVAEYALTNAHKRRIIVDQNNRQAHAFCSERLNCYAQWDIKNLAKEYATLIKEESPLTNRLLCGKHEFDKTYGR